MELVIVHAGGVTAGFQSRVVLSHGIIEPRESNWLLVDGLAVMLSISRPWSNSVPLLC